MKVLIVTTEWPRFDGDIGGIHVVQQKRRLEQAGLQVDVFPFRGQKNPLNYWRASLLLKNLNLAQYDVVHAHHGQAGIVALSQRQCPVVVTFHGSDLQGIRDMQGYVTPLGYVLRFSSRWVASRAKSVILVSEHLSRYLPAGVDYQVIPAGIDLERFYPMPIFDARRALGLPQNKPLVLFVGDPARTEKRYWLAEKAVNSLPASLHAQLVLAHNIPHEQMPLFMNACDVLLITSSTEGSPSVVKEALACNLPIVSTDVGDIRDRVDSIAGCFICSNNNSTYLAATLQQVLLSPVRINGRDAVRALDEVILTQKILSIYERYRS